MLSAEQSAKSDALRIIARRHRSRQQLSDLLKAKGHAAKPIDQVLDQLEKAGLLNDEKYAKAVADSKLYLRPVGRRRLERDLKKKGLSDGVVRQTMESFKDYDETAAAMEVAQKRIRVMKNLPSEKKKARLFGFLQRRGFSSEAIYAALSKAIKEETVF